MIQVEIMMSWRTGILKSRRKYRIIASAS